jgi:hypothetical protein
MKTSAAVVPHLTRHPANLRSSHETTYRRRLSELREELKEAKKWADVERAEQAELEINPPTGELSRSVRLGAVVGGPYQLQNGPGRAYKGEQFRDSRWAMP